MANVKWCGLTQKKKTIEVVKKNVRHLKTFSLFYYNSHIFTSPAAFTKGIEFCYFQISIEKAITVDLAKVEVQT